MMTCEKTLQTVNVFVRDILESQKRVKRALNVLIKDSNFWNTQCREYNSLIDMNKFIPSSSKSWVMDLVSMLSVMFQSF